METVQQNGRFTLFSSKFSSNIYSILYVPCISTLTGIMCMRTVCTARSSWLDVGPVLEMNRT